MREVYSICRGAGTARITKCMRKQTAAEKAKPHARFENEDLKVRHEGKDTDLVCNKQTKSILNTKVDIRKNEHNRFLRKIEATTITCAYPSSVIRVVANYNFIKFIFGRIQGVQRSLLHYWFILNDFPLRLLL